VAMLDLNQRARQSRKLKAHAMPAPFPQHFARRPQEIIDRHIGPGARFEKLCRDCRSPDERFPRWVRILRTMNRGQFCPFASEHFPAQI
jgi:hypothetical protein